MNVHPAFTTLLQNLSDMGADFSVQFRPVYPVYDAEGRSGYAKPILILKTNRLLDGVRLAAELYVVDGALANVTAYRDHTIVSSGWGNYKAIGRYMRGEAWSHPFAKEIPPGAVAI